MVARPQDLGKREQPPEPDRQIRKPPPLPTALPPSAAGAAGRPRRTEFSLLDARAPIYDQLAANSESRRGWGASKNGASGPGDRPRGTKTRPVGPVGTADLGVGGLGTVGVSDQLVTNHRPAGPYLTRGQDATSWLVSHDRPAGRGGGLGEGQPVGPGRGGAVRGCDQLVPSATGGLGDETNAVRAGRPWSATSWPRRPVGDRPAVPQGGQPVGPVGNGGLGAQGNPGRCRPSNQLVIARRPSLKGDQLAWVGR